MPAPIPARPVKSSHWTGFTRAWVRGLVLSQIVLAGCYGSRPIPPAPTTTPLPPALVRELSTGDGDSALTALIVAEREASINGNLALLTALWAEDARIVDGRGTATPDDDLIWQGRKAILDRYRLAVFPAPPPPLDAKALDQANLQIEGGPERATPGPRLATLMHGGDRWQFVAREGRWWLFELIYSTP